MFGLFGLTLLVIFLGVGAVARRFHVGPRWLRQARIHKNTLF